MAGVKRKVDTSRSPGSQAAALSETPTQSQTRVATHGKGTRGSSRLVASDTPSAPSEDNVASEATGVPSKSAEEQEPRFKRLRLVHKAEPPKATRYSTRSKVPTDSSSVETPQSSRRQSVNGGSSSQPASSMRRFTRQLSSKSANFDSTDSSEVKATPENPTTPSRKPTATASPSKSLRGRKRPAEETSKEETTEVDGSPSALKKPKLEDDEVASRLSQDDSNTVDGSQNAKADSPAPISQETPVEETTDFKTTDDVNGNISNPTENGSTPSARGRGGRGRSTGRARGYRGRGRGAARGGGTPLRGSGRGRGGRGGRGGGRTGKRGDDDSDFEQERSPSPVPASQKLLDRQKELKQSWKRLAASQRLLLNTLATRSQNRLIRDKTAHRKAEEYEEVQADLQAALEKRLKCLENEHRLRVEVANTLLVAEKAVIQDRFEANAVNIREELFYAARGDYMALVEGVQHAEDDEHTEPDLDRPEPAEVADAETGSNYEPLYKNEPQFRRGYNSKAIREPSGAASYELGRNDWEEFVQRVKMKEISQDESVPSGPDTLDILLQAVDIVSQAVASVDNGLSTLADAASNAQPASPLQQKQQQHQQQHQHQHQPQPQPQKPPPPAPVQPQSQPQTQATQTTEPPTYLLPRPSPARPVLGTSYNLPNPFTTGRGPPQLPPPPGVSFTRPGSGMPGFFPGPQQQPPQHQYQPTPGPAPATAPGQAPYYYSGHPPPPPPPPPPRKSSSPHRRPY